MTGCTLQHGALLIYFGTRRTYPDLAHHTIVLGPPRYEALLDDIFKHKRLAADMSLYLHAPTLLSDASLTRRQSRECFYVRSRRCRTWQAASTGRASNTTSPRRDLRRCFQARLRAGLHDALVTERLFTPADFETELLSWLGAGFNFEPKC